LKYRYRPSPGLQPGDRPLAYTFKVDMLVDGKVVSGATAAVTVAKAEVAVQPPRVIVLDLSGGATESTETFTAVAKPEGRYRFDWDFGDGQQFSEIKAAGERSTVRHTFRQLGTILPVSPKVSLFSAEGTLLAADSIEIEAGGGVAVEWDCGWPVDYSKLKKMEVPVMLRYYYDTNSGLLAHGPTLHWYDASRGQLRQAECFKDNKYHGRQTYWHENGVKSREIEWRDGVRVGTEYQWYPNGAKYEERHFQQGASNGLYTLWHPNGALKSQGQYIDNKMVGVWTSWNENGTCDSRIDHKDGSGLVQYLPCQ
jgi:hypothetical protein